MDARTIRLVQAGWASATARPGLANRFYARLFAVEPALRPLFAADIEAQAAKFTRMLDAVIARLDDLDAFLPLVREMGARHELYGVRDTHYQTVGDVLIDTLAESLGPAFTAEAEIAWATAYSLIAQAMMGAAHHRRVREEAHPDPPPADAL